MQRVLFFGQVLEAFLGQQIVRFFSEILQHLVTLGQWLKIQTESSTQQRQNLRDGQATFMNDTVHSFIAIVL
mgnify:CR=1 FL=1